MDEALLARLRACGGDDCDEPPSPWGSYRIFTPRGNVHRIVWATPDAIAEMCKECEEREKETHDRQ